MVANPSQKLDAAPSFEDIEKALKENRELRAAVIKCLARDHASEYLAHVNIKASFLQETATRFISSEKEWQE